MSPLSSIKLYDLPEWMKGYQLDYFTYLLRKRRKQGRNAMTAFIGRVRSGKSTAATMEAEMDSLNHPFRAKDCTFLPVDYLHNIRQSAEGDNVEFDEPGAEWGNRAFMSVESKMLNATHITFGSKQVDVEWAVPSLHMQDKTARLLVNYVFEMWETGTRGMSYWYKTWTNAFSGDYGRQRVATWHWAPGWRTRPEEAKEYLEMKEQYQDKSYERYYKELARADDEFRDKVEDSRERMRKGIEVVAKDPAVYAGAKGTVKREMVHLMLAGELRGLTSREAEAIANSVNLMLAGARRKDLQDGSRPV